METKTQKIIRLAIIASCYATLTIVLSFISYGQIQIRISEVLVLLCFFRKDYIIALTLGCFISNLFSPFLVYDIIFGTVATLISCYLIYKSKNLLVAAIFPVIFNGLIVGLEIALITETSILINILYVALGEFIAMLIGYLIFSKLAKSKNFMEIIKATNKERKIL